MTPVFQFRPFELTLDFQDGFYELIILEFNWKGLFSIYYESIVGHLVIDILYHSFTFDMNK